MQNSGVGKPQDLRDFFKERTHKIKMEVEILLEKVGPAELLGILEILQPILVLPVQG